MLPLRRSGGEASPGRCDPGQASFPHLRNEGLGVPESSACSETLTHVPPESRVCARAMLVPKQGCSCGRDGPVSREEDSQCPRKPNVKSMKTLGVVWNGIHFLI